MLGCCTRRQLCNHTKAKLQTTIITLPTSALQLGLRKWETQATHGQPKVLKGRHSALLSGPQEGHDLNDIPTLSPSCKALSAKVF